ncbi:hypothetical protein CKC_05810 [Candidatus Liberibacter solanacearum CLso-ZC1]|uniref:Uncharacterized protein n=1 Tax=Liberibacter solanacearum (strain CLso-ZC1) TaxID=658172 RepID=E4UE79_LIBSC|nr:hypothetical protein CKC_05810 [Candidatus Liberibacter solanacearum CLso-ZC1]
MERVSVGKFNSGHFMGILALDLGSKMGFAVHRGKQNFLCKEGIETCSGSAGIGGVCSIAGIGGSAGRESNGSYDEQT